MYGFSAFSGASYSVKVAEQFFKQSSINLCASTFSPRIGTKRVPSLTSLLSQATLVISISGFPQSRVPPTAFAISETFNGIINLSSNYFSANIEAITSRSS